MKTSKVLLIFLVLLSNINASENTDNNTTTSRHLLGFEEEFNNIFVSDYNNSDDQISDIDKNTLTKEQQMRIILQQMEETRKQNATVIDEYLQDQKTNR